MMDSQENALQQEGKLEENAQAAQPQPAAEPEATPQPAATPEAAAQPAAELVAQATPEAAEKVAKPEKKVYTSKQEIIQRANEIVNTVDNPDKEEVEHLKASFYRLHVAERDQRQKEYLEAGGDPQKYQFQPDPDEDTFKTLLQAIREKRAKAHAEQEEQRLANLKRKEEIIEKIKGMTTSPDEANKSFNDFKALQQEWKTIGPVPPEKSSETWRNYQLYVEQFYDLLNLNREAREYDFKKNLEAKTKLCEAAEKLADEPDVVTAFRKLQDLHAQYRETGPVAREQREEIWNRFKAASTVINKRHQEHFEKLRANEEENLKHKTELCERAEAIAQEENKGGADWERHTKEIIALQQEWKTVGFAPQKMNQKIFERFRAVCDDFFKRKSEHFKELKAQYAENADKKRALIEQAKALQDSTDWKETSDKLIALQKEWKTIGTVPKRLGDQLWSDFLGACNHFFEARNAVNAGTREAERENLKKKRDIITQLRELAESAGDATREKVQELADQFNAVGHVPFRDKEKVYKEFREVMDKIYSDLHISYQRRRMDNFRNNLRGMAKRGEEVVDNERSRLTRQLEQLRSEISTYENNLGFLSVASKKGNSLVDEMNRKVQRLKDDADLVRQKIKEIDLQARQKAKEEAAAAATTDAQTSSTPAEPAADSAADTTQEQS